MGAAQDVMRVLSIPAMFWLILLELLNELVGVKGSLLLSIWYPDILDLRRLSQELLTLTLHRV